MSQHHILNQLVSKINHRPKVNKYKLNLLEELKYMK